MNAVHFNQKGELVRDDEVTEEIEMEEKEKPLMPDDLKNFSSLQPSTRATSFLLGVETAFLNFVNKGLLSTYFVDPDKGGVVGEIYRDESPERKSSNAVNY
ncbi:hypothetical protein V9T40_000798 [Parthenolecanium corni]|uniref:Uncharacterized protein n=1 Tax=Parthenolecanium corni TaxID=536013 RepID=A0AAN9Y0T0_9HEMI